MKKLLCVAVCAAIVSGFTAFQADLSSAMGRAPKKEDLSNYRVNPDELMSIGLSEESFPPILEPKFDPADKTPFSDQDMVLGVVINGEAKAYPVNILNYHELVNDVAGGEPVLVTYSLLGDLGVVYSRKVKGEVAVFSNTGQLFRSNPLFYDGRTRTYWSQAWGMGIKGPHVNVQLAKFPAVRTTLGLWKKAYPTTLVLSKKTGSTRNYFKYPYGDYYTNDRMVYPVLNFNSRKQHPKDAVTFVAEPDNKVVHNKFSGAFRQFEAKAVKEKGFEVAPFGNRWVVALWDPSFETVRIYETPEEAASVAGGVAALKSGKKIALKGLKELPSSRAFAFVLPGLFQ